MEDKRVQLSLRFDAYSEVLDEAKSFCKNNRITLTDFVGLCVIKGLELGLGALKDEETPHEARITALEAKFEGIKKDLNQITWIVTDMVKHLKLEKSKG